MTNVNFIKMQGLGNDFVIIDHRTQPIALSKQQLRHLADRRRGIGCDQVIVMRKASSSLADLAISIYNPDGSEAQACGNGTRCVASLVMEEGQGQDHLIVESVAGLLDAERKDDLIQVDMGLARLDWREIPLSQACDTAHLPLELGPLKDGVAVNVGNPHAVFFVDAVETVALAELGPILEHHPLFPERANIEIVSVLNPKRLRMRVWERGAGITEACGSGACAAAIAAHRRGLSQRQVKVELDGGELSIEWMKDNHVKMSGPATMSFAGQIFLAD